MPLINRTAQSAIAPFAAILTVVLWSGTWMEILSHGHWHFQDDLSKLYLGVMAAYAGAAEVCKWMVIAPTDAQEDPMFERIQRGGFFIALWLFPLLVALVWRVFDTTIPMPGPLEKITLGLVGIFFVKATSRHLRHKNHGVLGEAADGAAAAPRFEEVLYQKIATAPNGLLVSEITATFPDASPPTLYRAFDKLVKARRLTRTGKPRTPEVRYRATLR